VSTSTRPASRSQAKKQIIAALTEQIEAAEDIIGCIYRRKMRLNMGATDWLAQQIKTIDDMLGAAPKTDATAVLVPRINTLHEDLRQFDHLIAQARRARQ
jgi:hypothetical protein